ncbi:MAG: 1-deoxy-D-xylulose 5-phosphate reductoisomerase [candidate division Zixibacteria bacterium RBG-1]|nr:MAG: 1-deoxy-D-xylulose 5-phosphate reductoisomerase [candidate division Zixibacteria bacterium RBG-1]OGC84783.1 MAG: 1-deoxy-D-xylulose-5-phosphate reductoisomerase [candidate division Zixibacteria bacterium RBG_19FT_COMBO_42_43]
MKNLVILGSTGSIGRNTLEVIEPFPQDFRVWGLSGHSNIELLEAQTLKFNPEFVTVTDEKSYQVLKGKVPGSKLLFGIEGLKEMVSQADADMVINGLVGSVGLFPSLTAIENGKTLALANKEVLVMAGELVTQKAQEKKAQILPIDSEHSGIFQCLFSGKKEEVKNLFLTASGGPFLNRDKKDFDEIKVSDALAHPTWKMGKKITVDSATLMNKTLEIIEAHWLFNMAPEKIKVVIHPQSIVHSLVEFIDGSIIAQMGATDMKLPIQYALFYPERKVASSNGFNLSSVKTLTFQEPDTEKFPAVKLGYQALKLKGTAPAVLNAANEVAVNCFLEEKIPFSRICPIVEEVLSSHSVISAPSLDDILKADLWGREKTLTLIKN